LRYGRVLDAVAELEALAVSGGEVGERIDEFLRCDDTVIARMASASGAGDQAGRAGQKAKDIARGSLRLSARTNSGAIQ
jgi:hypothetical protein